MVGWCFNAVDTKWQIWFEFIHFAVVQDFDQKSTTTNISYEGDAEDNTRWVRCTSIHIVY